MAEKTKLSTKEEYEPRAEAVSYALTLLRKSKSATWEDFMESLHTEEETAVKAVQFYALSDEQMNLLQTNQAYLALINVEAGVTPAFCTGCQTVSLHHKSAAKKCVNTRGCTGEMVKPIAAKSVK